MARRVHRRPPLWRIVAACFAAPLPMVVLSAGGLLTAAAPTRIPAGTVGLMLTGVAVGWVIIAAVVALIHFGLRRFGPVTLSGCLLTGTGALAVLAVAQTLWLYPHLPPGEYVSRGLGGAILGFVSGLLHWAAGFAGVRPPPSDADVF